MRVSIIAFLVTACFAHADLPGRPPVLDFKKKVDYVGWLNARHLSGIDEDQNAPGLYLPLTENGELALPAMTPIAEKQFDQLGFGELWSPDDYPAMAAHVERCAPQIEFMRKASRRAHIIDIVPGDLESLYYYKRPSLSAIRNTNKMLILRSWQRQPNQEKAVMDAVRTTLNVARQVSENGYLIDGLVGIAGRAMAYDSVNAAVKSFVLKPSSAAKAYRFLIKHDKAELDWILAIDVEWVMRLSILQSICPNGQYSVDKWHKTLQEIANQQYEKQAVVRFDPIEARDLIDKHKLRLRNIVVQPLSQTTFLELDRYAKKYQAQVQNNSFVNAIALNLAFAYQVNLCHKGFSRGTRTMLALLAHRDKHGAWPPRLDAIDAKLDLPDLKENCIDPFTRDLFIYKVDGDEMTLYSAALDQKDDGGKHDPKWAKEKTNHDYVFWPIQDER